MILACLNSSDGLLLRASRRVASSDTAFLSFRRYKGTKFIVRFQNSAIDLGRFSARLRRIDVGAYDNDK